MVYSCVPKFQYRRKVEKHPWTNTAASDGMHLPQSETSGESLLTPAQPRRLSVFAFQWAKTGSESDAAIAFMSKGMDWLMPVWFQR